MLFTLYPLITQNYFLLCLIVCLGTLQWAAARHHKPAISLLGRWGLGWPGQVAGLLLVIGGFGWFFTVTPGLFAPGLAGGELSPLFAGGCLLAVLIARLSGAMWQGMENRVWKIEDGK
jgi:hypothetical protein